MLHSVFPEEDIFRIDHYLGKEAIQNILYFRFANSFLEPIWNRNYVRERADHDGRGLRRAGPRRVLRGGRRAARRHPEPPVPDRRAARDGAAASGPGVEELRDEQGEGVRARCDTLKPRRPRARAVRGLPRRAGRRARLRRRDVRRGAAAHRLVALGRRAVLRPRRQEPAGDVHRGARRAAPAAATVFAEYEHAAARHQLHALPAQPAASSIAIGARVEGAGRRLHRRAASSCSCATTTRARCRRTSGCSATRCDGETLLFAREDGVEASWRVVDNVLTDHDAGDPVSRCTRGVPRSRTA